VKSTESDIVGAAAEQRRDALAHLARRLVGEGNGEDAPGRHALVRHKVGDAVCDHARLAAAGPGDDQHRAFGGRDSAALFRIEVREHVHVGGP
jgi:hypothetical protein